MKAGYHKLYYDNLSRTLSRTLLSHSIMTYQIKAGGPPPPPPPPSVGALATKTVGGGAGGGIAAAAAAAANRRAANGDVLVAGAGGVGAKATVGGGLNMQEVLAQRSRLRKVDREAPGRRS